MFYSMQLSWKLDLHLEKPRLRLRRRDPTIGFRVQHVRAHDSRSFHPLVLCQ